MSSLSTSLKNSFQKWLFPYEEYLRIAKPAVQQQIEFEYGGPFTPSSASSPLKRSHQDTPSSLRDDSPAIHASAALNASIQASEQSSKDPPLGSASAIASPPPPQLPHIVSSGFTAVNTGGFTAVNMTPASFQAVNSHMALTKRDDENNAPGHTALHPGPIAAQPQDKHRQLGHKSGPLGHLNGHSPNPLKRTVSGDTPGGDPTIDPGIGADLEDENGRRSKRLKKGKPPRSAA